MEDKQVYYRIKEDFGTLSRIAKQIDTISDILNTYFIGDMPLREVKSFLEDRFFKIDKDAYDIFIANKININLK